MTQTRIAPLEGVRVLELGNYIAAPTAGRMLADFGAEVIKVERPGTGDELRNWRLHKGDTSMLYRTINRNKKSVVLDLRTEAGKQAVLELAAKSDILLENFRPGTLEKWGLGPEVLNEANPDLIITRISAFGQTGPLSAAARLRRRRRSVRRVPQPGRGPGPRARPGRSVDRGLDRRTVRRVRLHDEPLPAGSTTAGRGRRGAAHRADHRRRAERGDVLHDGIPGSRLPGLRRGPAAGGRPDGGNRPLQRLHLQGRCQHRGGRQRGLDLPALHGDHRAPGPGRRPGPADQCRPLGPARRTRPGHRRVDRAAGRRRGLGGPGRRRGSGRSHLHRGGHQHRQPVRGTEHDPEVRCLHRGGDPARRGLPRHCSGDR